MTRCKCGSYAVNYDPEEKLCDVCHAYDLGQKAMRESVAEFIETRRTLQDAQSWAKAIRRLPVEKRVTS